MRIRMMVAFAAMASAFTLDAPSVTPAFAQGARASDIVNRYRVSDAEIDQIAVAVKAKASHNEKAETEEAAGGNTAFFLNKWMEAQPVLLKLAQGGSAAGAFFLGQLYDRGFDIQQGASFYGHIDPDAAKSARLYRIAADTGMTSAMRRMGEMYAMGRGVPKDPALAKEWQDKFDKAFFGNNNNVSTECYVNGQRTIVRGRVNC